MYKQSVKAVRRLRSKIFDYPPEKCGQADRALEYLLERAQRQRRDERQSVGPYSGLTRRELARTGTVETDWV